MDIVGTFMSAVITPFMGNSTMQTIALGLLVKWGTDRLKTVLKEVDENGVAKGYSVQIQLVVMLCTALATLGDLALKGQLHTANIDALVNFITVALPTYLSAIGIHFAAKDALVHFTGEETIKGAVEAAKDSKDAKK